MATGPGEIPRRQPSTGRTTPPRQYNDRGNTAPAPADPYADAINDFINIPVVPSGGNAAADKTAALKDIDIARRELTFQEKIGLRDIEQDRTLSLQKADNNALQRGIFHSGIRTDNRNLVGREADEAAGDLRQQIAFALERLANREANVHAGGGAGGSMGGGSGISPGMMLEIFSRIMGAGNEYGWYMPAPPARTPVDRVSGSTGTGTVGSGWR